MVPMGEGKRALRAEEENQGQGEEEGLRGENVLRGRRPCAGSGKGRAPFIPILEVRG